MHVRRLLSLTLLLICRMSLVLAMLILILSFHLIHLNRHVELQKLFVKLLMKCIKLQQHMK